MLWNKHSVLGEKDWDAQTCPMHFFLIILDHAVLLMLLVFKIVSFLLKFVPIPCVSIGGFQYFMLHVYWPFQKFCAKIYKEKVWNPIFHAHFSNLILYLVNVFGVCMYLIIPNYVFFFLKNYHRRVQWVFFCSISQIPNTEMETY